MNTAKKLLGKTYRHFMHDSLYRNSIYLLLNMGVTAIAGFLFVVECTHLFSQQEFGYATALIGALGLAASLSNIGMNRTLVRFLGKSKRKSQDLITSTAIVLAGSLIIGFVMSFFLRSFGISHPSPVLILLFLFSAVVVSLKGLTDNVFIATRSASGTFLSNGAFSITKLFIPFLVVGSGYVGIFSSQLVAGIAGLTVAAYILKTRHNFSLLTRPSRTSMNGKWRFAFGSYTSDLVGGLPASVLPIIVVAKLGAVSGALWFTVMQIVNFILTISSSINQAMFAEMANATGSITHFARKALIAMYGIVVPITVIIFLLANHILKIFSGNYVTASHLLRIMAVFALIGVANYVTGSILALHKKMAYLTLVNALNAAIVIIYCLIFARSLYGIAYGWVIGEIVNVILFVGGALYVLRNNDLNNIESEARE